MSEEQIPEDVLDAARRGLQELGFSWSQYVYHIVEELSKQSAEKGVDPGFVGLLLGVAMADYAPALTLAVRGELAIADVELDTTAQRLEALYKALRFEGGDPDEKGATDTK